MPRTDTGTADLTKIIVTRISAKAKTLIKERAKREGIPPATWTRIKLYSILGLIDPAKE